MTKFLLGVIVLLVLALVGGGMWQKIKINALVIANINLTTERNVAVATKVAIQQELDTTMVQVDSFIEQIAHINAERARAREEVDYIKDLFQDHDFAKILKARPSWIEKKMIKKTAEVLQELEDVSK